MGRRQLKNGAGATIQYQVDIEIAPIVYTKQQLEYSKSTIATFANALINKNKPHGVEVSRRHVIALWTINVQRVYPVGEPKREELLGQIDSPLFHEFWMAHTLAPTHQDGSRVFQKAPQGLSRLEKNMYPGSIAMENQSMRILVPRILLLSFDQVTFLDMVRWVLEANLSTNILRSDMVDLWNSVIYDIYSFQCSCSQAKKASESDEADSFTTEGYEWLVQDVIEAKTRNENPPQGVKRARPEAQTSADEHGGEIDEGSSGKKRTRKRRSPTRSAPEEDSVLPSIESPPSTSPAMPLPPNSPSSSAASHQSTTMSEQNLVRLELERQQDSEQTARQIRRPSGLRMMQIRRGTSESRRGRVIYELPDL